MSCIPDSTDKHFLDSGIWIPMHGATDCNLDLFQHSSEFKPLTTHVDNHPVCLQLVGILNPVMFDLDYYFMPFNA